MPHNSGNHNDGNKVPDNVIALPVKLHPEITELTDEHKVVQHPATHVASQEVPDVVFQVDAASGSEENPVDGIEVLVNLAKLGKIDPWNIDILQVADEYLKALDEYSVLNLKLTGKTLLMAAILLRMKSDKLAGVDYLTLTPPIEEADFGEDADWNEMQASYPYHSPFETIKNMTLEALNGLFGKLDKTLDRRTSTKAHRKRRVTLDDLIREFQVYEEIERRKALQEAVERVDKRRQRRQNYENLSTDEIIELAHDEFIEETIMDVKAVLYGLWANEEKVELKALFKELPVDRVSIFVAVLFLASRGEAYIEQDEFYKELYVLPESAVPALSTDELLIQMATDNDALEEAV